MLIKFVPSGQKTKKCKPPSTNYIFNIHACKNVKCCLHCAFQKPHWPVHFTIHKLHQILYVCYKVSKEFNGTMHLKYCYIKYYFWFFMICSSFNQSKLSVNPQSGWHTSQDYCIFCLALIFITKCPLPIAQTLGYWVVYDNFFVCQKSKALSKTFQI